MTRESLIIWVLVLTVTACQGAATLRTDAELLANFKAHEHMFTLLIDNMLPDDPSIKIITRTTVEPTGAVPSERLESYHDIVNRLGVHTLTSENAERGKIYFLETSSWQDGNVTCSKGYAAAFTEDPPTAIVGSLDELLPEHPQRAFKQIEGALYIYADCSHE